MRRKVGLCLQKDFIENFLILFTTADFAKATPGQGGQGEVFFILTSITSALTVVKLHLFKSY